jgi:hypothetical protein
MADIILYHLVIDEVALAFVAAALEASCRGVIEAMSVFSNRHTPQWATKWRAAQRK